MVAGLEFGDAGADLLNDAATLVSENDWVLLPAEHFDDRWIHRHVASDHVLVGVAHAARNKTHEDLIGLRVIELDLFDLVLGMRGVQDCGSCPHGNSLSGEGLAWRHSPRNLGRRSVRRVSRHSPSTLFALHYLLSCKSYVARDQRVSPVTSESHL